MADPTFSQPERRNLTGAIFLVLAALGIAAAILIHFIPSRTAAGAVTGTQIYAAHTVYKADSIVVGRDQSQDDLYILAMVDITNHLHIPLYLKDFTSTLTPAQGDPITTPAIETPDIPNLYTTYPALKALAKASPALLDRDTTIAPGQTVSGTILLHFPTTQSTWDGRQSATLDVAFYHQPNLTIPVPKR